MNSHIANYWKSYGLLQARHKAELTGMMYAYTEVYLTPEEGKNFKARAKELMERQRREVDDFYEETDAAINEAEKEGQHA